MLLLRLLLLKFCSRSFFLSQQILRCMILDMHAITGTPTLCCSGTHWIWEVVCMLIKGSTEYMKEVKEFLFLEAIPDLGAIESLRSPRPLNTHLPYRWMPKQHIENGGKIIHVIRNPKDVAVSMYYHYLTSGVFNKDFTFEKFLTNIFCGPGKFLII